MSSLLLIGSIIISTIFVPVVLTLDEYKVIKTNSGPVRGKSEHALFTDKPYYAFRGIPYAEPPLRNLRFKPPAPKRSWEKTLDALNFASMCYQRTSLTNEILGKEDCLYLNIYTPDVEPDEKLAVIFYIHGGGFYEGSGNDEFYGPDFLINGNVILVTINYRLGVFGFLSLGTAEYSGNMALKDQQLALKWINENIHHFGGDKNRITIGGHSAGAASAHYHMLAPSSKGMFKRAIAMSGSALNPWSMFESREHLLYIYDLSKWVDEPVYNFKDLVAFVKDVDGKKIMEHINPSPNLEDLERGDILTYAPVVENKHAHQIFLKQSAEQIYNGGFTSDIDAMFGFTSAEWLFQLKDQLNQPDLLKPLDEHFDIHTPFTKLMEYHETDEYRQMQDEIRNFYFGEDVTINNDTLYELSDVQSDIYIVYGVDKAVKLQAKHSVGKTFYYRFAVDAALNAFKILYHVTSMTGASHADDVCYLFKCNIIPHLYEHVEEGSIEINAIQNTVKLWTNFAKYGVPLIPVDGVQLNPVTDENVHFLEIDNEGLSTALNPHHKFMQFWNNLYEKYDKIFSNDNNIRDEL